MKSYIALVIFLFSLTACNSQPEAEDKIEETEAKAERLTEELEESGETLSQATQRTQNEVDSLLQEIEK
jgi:uncharacterized protein YcfL